MLQQTVKKICLLTSAFYHNRIYYLKWGFFHKETGLFWLKQYLVWNVFDDATCFLFYIDVLVHVYSLFFLSIYFVWFDHMFCFSCFSSFVEKCPKYLYSIAILLLFLFIYFFILFSIFINVVSINIPKCNGLNRKVNEKVQANDTLNKHV